MSDASADRWLQKLNAVPSLTTAEGKRAVERHFSKGEAPAPVLADFLAELTVREGRSADDAERRRTARREALDALRVGYINQIVDFLAGSQPGAMSALARDVCRGRHEIFRRLGTDVDTVAAMVAKKSASP